MPWLVRDGQVLASLELAETRRARRKGLLGRDSLEGALALVPARSVHSFGMGAPIDVAFVDRAGEVLSIVRLRPRRVTLPRWRARSVIEAAAGSFERWGLAVGQQVEYTPGD